MDSSGYRFGDLTLDSATRQLVRDGTPVHLSPKAFQLLHVLVEAAPRALSKAELQDRLWPDTFVIEANLQHLIGEIRAVLCDDHRRPRYIRTVHRFGYAFQEVPTRTHRRIGSRAVVCRLRWDTGRASLGEGDHILGRDPSADVVIDSTAVSRRHARIRVSRDGITIEDLGSKNGSFVGDCPVRGVVQLNDGDEIRLATVPLVVRIMSGVLSTETVVRDAGAR